MTFVADLSSCEPFEASGVLCTAVGWLDANEPYARGPVEESAFGALCKLLVNPWQPLLSVGYHPCSFCRFTGGPGSIEFEDMEVVLGSNLLFVPSPQTLFVAPSLIAHYIDAHEYQPPESFLRAVTECPDMSSIAYKRSLLSAPGGRALVKWAAEAENADTVQCR